MKVIVRRRNFDEEQEQYPVNIFADYLMQAMEASEEVDNIRTFESAGYLTRDTGFTVKFRGKRFNVTVQEHRL